MIFACKIPDSLVRLLKICLLFTIVLPLVFACKNKTVREIQDNPQTPIISNAKRFRIEVFQGYSQVSVFNPWQGASDVAQTWYLVKEGIDIPAGIDESEVIRVPVRNIVCMSTTHLAMISALGETGSVTGFSGTGFIYEDDLKELVDDGTIREIGYDDNLNKELIIKLDPDLIMVYGVGGESAGYVGKLKELGIKVVFNADYLEDDPLGKAEWIRLLGALYCKEHLADSIFRDTEKKYNELRKFMSEKVGGRPDVLLGLPFRDTWYISPGNSYISRLINDAGGNYLWQSTESSVSLPTALENVYMKALNADFWLNIGTADSKMQILSIDPRLADLQSFKKGNLYNNTKRKNPDGGNDYWEGGCINPHIVLKDIATILHPELFPGEELIYYKKLN
jgi:iron complex transport system substrate-binding protein